MSHKSFENTQKEVKDYYESIINEIQGELEHIKA